MSPGRRRPRAGAILAFLYGGSTAVAGILLALGAGTPAGTTVPAPTSVTAASLLTAVPPTGPGSSTWAADAVPPALVGRGSAAVRSFRPTLLVLPDGRTAPVTGSGLHPDGSLVIPDDPATVGWWDGGAYAGDVFGSVVIAGHVDSARFGLGVMAQLKTLQPGQDVELRSGDQRQRYRISSRQQLPQAELAARSDAFRQDLPSRLVLITCSGAFDVRKHRYQDNLILFAEPVGSAS